MSAATSPGTGLAYGLRRVCAAWGMARSSFYAMTSGQHAEQPPAKRRGPKPAISDQALLVAIEADLEASPWEGEGYRKVWARLRVCRDIRVARKRVLRLMRENNLLSPHRCRRRGGNPHDGEIITHAPNLMWGTDGVRVFTVDDGWGWIFTAVEHWNAECVGWHVCKRGDRFAALQPISMGLAGLYGSTAAGAARGLALRMDHGSQYLSDHFTNQIKFWGIQPSYAFVAEPQTNGVAERFNRTLKEQIIHGRIYRNIAELRDAVRDFVELYNAQWIVEKNGYLSPAQARQAWHAAISIRPAPRETNLCPRNRVRYTKIYMEGLLALGRPGRRLGHRVPLAEGAAHRRRLRLQDGARGVTGRLIERRVEGGIEARQRIVTGDVEAGIGVGEDLGGGQPRARVPERRIEGAGVLRRRVLIVRGRKDALFFGRRDGEAGFAGSSEDAAVLAGETGHESLLRESF